MAHTTAQRTLVRPILLWVSLAAIVPAVAVEMGLLPNLRGNPLYLAMVAATTCLVLLSLGLTASGLRRRLPALARIGAQVALWTLVVADLAVFVVIPLATPQQVASEKPIQFASAPPSAAPTIAPSVAPSAAPAPTTLSGTFDARPGPDSVSGKATLGRTADGKVVLSLTGLNATPGPDLFVYLSTVESPGNDAQVKSGLELGKLRATKGDLNYELDSSVDYSKYRSAVIYCKSFSIVFGFANLK